RLDSDIDVLVNYAPVGETDFDEPTISNVTSTVANGLLSVSLTATDASSVDRVHVLREALAQPGLPQAREVPLGCFPSLCFPLRNKEGGIAAFAGFSPV
ncbi:hypothetical protein, partial [Leisingera caerulea]|uniref:hypothetical protein n=1 Tax=Leisingera caerulea TaxID=506591 RepID=UPI003F4A9E9D